MEKNGRSLEEVGGQVTVCVLINHDSRRAGPLGIKSLTLSEAGSEELYQEGAIRSARPGPLKFRMFTII